MPKPRAWMAAMAALLATAPLAARSPVALPDAAPDAALAEGQIISSTDDVTIGGWRRLYGGNYVKRTHFTGVTSETRECCFSVFAKGKALLVLKTETAGLDAKGEPLTERIVRAKWITRKPGEQVTDCQLLWISPQLSLYDTKSEAIRSVVIENGEFVLVSWRDPGSYCSHGD